MKKESLTKEARAVMKDAKEYLKKFGFLMPASFIICENENLIVPGDFNNRIAKQAYYHVIRKLIKEVDAQAVISIGDAWCGHDENNLPPAQDPSRGEALVLTASMPSYSLHISQPYSRLGDRIVFGDEMIWESEEGQGTAYSKAFVEVWDDDSNFDESKLSVH